MLEAAISDRSIPVTEKRFPKGDVLLDLYSFTINTSRPFAEVLAERAPHFSGARGGDRRGLPALPGAQARAPTPATTTTCCSPGSGCSTRARRPPRQLAASYDDVLVDEYQDTNRLQGEIVDGMARVKTQRDGRRRRRPGDLLLPRRLLREHPRVSRALSRRARRFRLTLNYRSTPEILALANASIAHNRRQFEKELVPSRAAGPLPAVVPLPDIPEQARFAAQRLLEWHDEGEKLADLAVLYRAHYQALELQIELTRRGIPYEIRSGMRFFEQRHVKDVLAFLRIVVNPKDELSWKRALKVFPRVGERAAAAVWEAIGARPDPLASFRERDGGRASSCPAAPAALEAVPRAARRLDSPALRSSPADAIRAGRRGRLPRLRAREVPERRRAPGRPRAVRAVRADLRLAAAPSSRKSPSSTSSRARTSSRGRPRTTASCSPRSTRPRASSGAA